MPDNLLHYATYSVHPKDDYNHHESSRPGDKNHPFSNLRTDVIFLQNPYPDCMQHPDAVRQYQILLSILLLLKRYAGLLLHSANSVLPAHYDLPSLHRKVRRYNYYSSQNSHL